MANIEASTSIDDRVKSHLQAVFSYFDLTPEITLATRDAVLMIEVTSSRDDLFTRGAADPLLALQHLLRVIIRREFPDTELTLSLNIGGFQQRQRARLAGVAKEAAEQARATNMAVYLAPMSSYERRLVHLALVDEAGIASESEGEGEDRRIVVRAI